MVPCSREAMFALVADVASYPRFVPWCRTARVRPVAEGVVEATLGMERGPVGFRLTTRNRETAPVRIEMRLVDGPFRSLEGEWSFEEREGGGTTATLRLEFEAGGRLLGRMAAPFLREAAEAMVRAFTKRAQELARTGPADGG